MGSDPTTDTPIFVDGIGPPLQQIREDYEGQPGLTAKDVLALTDEVERLLAELRQVEERLSEAEKLARVQVAWQNGERGDGVPVWEWEKWLAAGTKEPR